MNTLPQIKIIIGSTRQERFSEKPAHFIFEETKKRKDVEAELLDLRDYPMPFFDEPVTPSASKGKYSNAVVKKWALKIDDGDAFIIVTPEYNHGYPAVLKNALDSLYPEWRRKPVGFVSYGSVGGARSVEQLRQVVLDLGMVPIKASIHLPSEVYREVKKAKIPVDGAIFDPITKSPSGNRVELFLNDLIWFATALKTARAQIV